MSSGSEPPNDKYVALAVNPQTTNMSLWQSTLKRQKCRSGTERVRHFQQDFSYIMATSFKGERSRREPPTMGKQVVSFITCSCESSAPFFVIAIIHRFSRLVTLLFHKWLYVRLNHKDACILTLT